MQVVTAGFKKGWKWVSKTNARRRRKELKRRAHKAHRRGSNREFKPTTDWDVC